MRSITSIAAAAVVFLPCAIGAPHSSHRSYNLDPSSYKAENVIKTDVVVIGGGGTGTYAAIQLKDQGKKVVVVEMKDRLGGHTETYFDPESGLPIDMGVKLYHDEPLVHKWFSRFNLSTTRIDVSIAGAVSQSIDFRNGRIIQGLPAANQTAMALALQRYGAVLQKYPQITGGFYLPDPVPEDLYMPFGQFVQKYNIADAVQFIFRITSAFSDILELPALQQIRTLSLSLLATLNNFQTSSVMDNSLLFEKATDELLAAKSLLLSSRVLATQRVSQYGCVRVLVDTPEGHKLIVAKKILMTIPPTRAALAPFDIDQDEMNIFSQLQSVGYYTSIVKNAGPANVTLQNIALDKPYALPPMPAIYNVNPTGVNPSLSLVYYGTKVGQVLSDAEVKAAIIADLKRIQVANGFQNGEPEIILLHNHSPYNLMFDGNATKAGLYKQLYALQGKRNMFWTGATFRAHDSSASWAFTSQSVLPPLLASL